MTQHASTTTITHTITQRDDQSNGQRTTRQGPARQDTAENQAPRTMLGAIAVNWK
jgi:hypothetical protein